jgi:signal transduction histidine kinase
LRLSEKSKIVLPLLLIAVFVFSTFSWVYRFQNYEMERTIEAERLLDQIREGMQEINRSIQSGILTLDEKYAVQSARHSLGVIERLTALEKLHSEDAGAIRLMYLDYYVKIVSINSLFLENRVEEGRTRLAELEMNQSKMNTEMDRMLDLQIGQYREAVKNINVFIAVTSIIFTAVLMLIGGLFMHYSRMRKETEKTLIESEKMASLGTLTAGVAHEIRNPLTIILHGVEHLDSSLSSDPYRRDIIDGIKQAVLRADRIIKGLLSFSQKPSFQNEKVDVLSVIGASLLTLEQQRELQNIRIEKEFSSDMPKTLGDEGQLRQAFLNILMNAVEAMPEGGILRVLCRRTVSDSVAIIFADTGAGVPEAEIGKVLDPFYTTKQKFGNVGLGLSIARGIIEGHGGTLKIESVIGEGTRVTVTLPIA